MECGKVVKESVIPKGNDTTLYEVYNIYTFQKVPDPDNINKMEIKKGGIFIL